MSELFNGDKKNDDAFRKELLGDDDTFRIPRGDFAGFTKEQIARFHKMPVEQVRPGLFRRTKDGPVFIRE